MTVLHTYLLMPLHHGVPLRFHFGRQGIGMEESSEALPSDSLVGALISQAALREDHDPAAAPPFANYLVADAPMLRVSSLFPRIGTMPLLPRPMLELHIPDEELRSSIGKDFKRLRYLSPALFAAVCAGTAITEAPLMLQQGKVWLSAAESAALPKLWQRQGNEPLEQWYQRLKQLAIWKIDTVPHVTVDRETNASAYYEIGQVSFAEGCGLCGFVQADNASALTEFTTLLTMLGEVGLGGRRSSGMGGFTVVWGDDLPLTASGDRGVLLSRYIPRDTEFGALQSDRAAYQLSLVGGWLYSLGHLAQRRKRVRMVTEGAVLDLRHGPIHGAVLDVRPQYTSIAHPMIGYGDGTQHPVYRSGVALLYPIPLRSEAL